MTFAAYPGKIFDGKVLFVSDVLEPDTRRTKVRIAFDNPDKTLKPNMFANADFARRRKPPHGADLGVADDQRPHQRLCRGRALGFRAARCRDRLSGGRRGVIKSGLQPDDKSS